MSDLKLDSDHDLDVTDQAMSLVEDTEGDPAAIAQEIGITLLFHQGEWDLNVLVGVPWRSKVFIKNPGNGVVAALLTRAVRTVPGVLEVPKMDVDLDVTTRQATVDYSAKAQDGGVIEERIAGIV